MKEIWKDIAGYDGLYQISNFGKIKSRKRLVANRFGMRECGGITIKLSNNKGYSRVCLCKNNKKRGFLVHRLVAIHFIPNVDNKPCVNHKDGDKQNNYSDNLEWCTHSENNKHAFNVLGRKPSLTGAGKYRADGHNSKPIIQLTRNFEYIKEFPCIMDAADEINVNISSISAAHKKGFISGGFRWVLKENYDTKICGT